MILQITGMTISHYPYPDPSQTPACPSPTPPSALAPTPEISLLTKPHLLILLEFTTLAPFPLLLPPENTIPSGDPFVC